MKNIIDEKPTDKLFCRASYASNFVSDVDILNKRVLDVGCGFGWFELNSLDRGCSEVVGLEISNDHLLTAKRFIKNRKVKFKSDDVTNLSFDDCYFDTIVLWEVLEHLPKNTELKLFNELYRVLKPNGVLYLSTPYDSFYLLEKSFFKIEKLVVKGRFWNLVWMLDFYVSKWIFRRSILFANFISKMQTIDYTQDGFCTIFIKSCRIEKS